MALLAYNQTESPLPLAAGHPLPTLPPKSKGPLNVTSELKDLTNDQYAALNVQRVAGLIKLYWIGEIQYSTPGLSVFEEQSLPAWETIDRPNPADAGINAVGINLTSNQLNHTSDGIYWYDALGNLA